MATFIIFIISDLLRPFFMLGPSLIIEKPLGASFLFVLILLSFFLINFIRLRKSKGNSTFKERDSLKRKRSRAIKSSMDASNGQKGTPEDNELYEQAYSLVVKTRAASVSLLQRRLRIGYMPIEKVLKCESGIYPWINTGEYKIKGVKGLTVFTDKDEDGVEIINKIEVYIEERDLYQDHEKQRKLTLGNW